MQLNSSVNSNGCVSWGSTNEGGGGGLQHGSQELGCRRPLLGLLLTRRVW